jgi:dihydrofolate reductase
MRKLIATVFNYSLDGLLADQDSDFFDFCFSLPENQDPSGEAQLDFLRGAQAHVFGRGAYESIAHAMTTTNADHPFAPILNPAPKVVFSRTLKNAEWANTTIAAGDTVAEVERVRQGGEGYVLVWGGVRLWRSLIELDLIDEVHVNMYPYIAGAGTRLFDGVPSSYQLDLVSTESSPNGIIELRYRRHR